LFNDIGFQHINCDSLADRYFASFLPGLRTQDLIVGASSY